MSEVISNTKYQILTPNGYQDFSGIQKLRKNGYRFECDNGLYCEVSNGHRFMTRGGEEFSDDLSVNDTIVHRHYGEVKINKKINLSEMDVYDLLDVRGDRTFYANGFIHHNCEFIGSSVTVIDAMTLERLMRQRQEPEWLDQQGRFRIWEKPKSGGTYVLGVDTSKGIGDNFSVIQVFRVHGISPVRMQQVAVWEDNMTDVYTFASVVNKMSYYYNNAHMMIENNGEGAPVVNRIWWDYENENLINTGSKNKDLGIRATHKTKNLAVLLMKKLIEDGNIEIYDPRTVEQLADFQDLGNDKYGGVNTNDDCISALYWCLFVIEQDIFDESYTFTEEVNTDEEIWGVLSDIDEYQVDWSWLTDD